MTKKITKTNGYLPSVLKEKLKLLVVAAAFVTGGVQAQVVTTITTPGSGTFTVPANVATMTVECWGGGGAGGSAENTAFTDAASAVRAGGGAGGSYSKITITNPEAGNYDYAVGAGGIAPASGFSDGHVSNGGNTTFDHSTVNLARALGGPGAVSKSFSSTLNWTGTGAIAPTTGNIEGANITNFYGGNGGNALGTGTAGTGGGGGSAGYSSNGNAGTTLTGGAAVTGGASGGDGTNVATGATGSAGGSPGAGGAGSLIRKTSAITDLRYRAGGSGGNGQIKITYTLVAASSTVAMTAPANKTVVAIGGSVELSATIALKDGNTFTSIVFKDGSTTIPGTITNSGNVYSITYANVPAGRRVITAELTDNQETVTSATHIIYGGPVIFTGNKYAQSAITWNAGPWYDDPTNGQVVSAPAAGDNVYTQGYAVTISDDATCDNLTFTDAVGQIGIAADKTLTVRGKVDCAVASTADAFSTSNATSILKLTGAALTTTPYFIITDKAIPGIRVKNIVIQAADSKTYQFGESTASTYFHGAGSFTIKNGTTINLQPTMIMGQGGSNHFVVEDNAVVTANGAIKGISANASRTTQITINGSITCSGFLSATTLILGNSAIVKTAKADGGSYQTFDGWWGYPGIIVDGTSYGTPGSIAMGTNTTIEFNKGGNQNINGFVPANGTPMVGYAIPYVNLNLLGSGIKTVRSNLTFTGTMTIASGVTLAIPTGVTFTVASGSTLTGVSGSILTVASGGAIVNNGTIAITPTVTVTPIGTYSYNGTPQGPIAATNSGSGTSYTFSYAGTGTTSYGPSATLPTNAGTYTATATVAADGYYVQASSAATAFKILSTEPISAPNTNISSLTLAPSSTINISGNGSLVVNQNTTVSAVNVAAGGNITVNTGVTLGGTVTLESTADATATMVDKYDTPTQAAVVKQFVEAGRNWYVSAPISGAAYTTLDKGNSVVAFNEVTGLWDNVTSGTLTPGKGYIQVATALQGTQGTLSFGGTANSGDITVSLSRTDTKGNGFNLVGNPYPSYLSWSKITKVNTNVMSTAWFRTKKTVGAGGGYTFATVNAADTSNVIVIDNNANTTITKYIPPMQAYWVRLNSGASTTDYTVNNAMRSHADNGANKMKAPKQNTNQLVRLRIANNENADDAVVYFNANASNNFDNYDSPKMFESASTIKPEIFTQVGSEKLVINGLSTIPYDTEIPVGFVTKQEGNYSIAATELLNFDSTTKLMLKDKQNPSIETELTPETAYNFSATVTPASTNRFSLIFRTAGAATGIENTNTLGARVYVNTNSQLVIAASKESNYNIYNTLGQQIENGILKTELQTIDCKLQTGIYVVKVNNQSTRVIVK